MDLPLYLRVLWRRKLILVVGLVCAAAAMIFSAYRLQDGSLERRTAEEYRSTARVLIERSDESLFKSHSTVTTVPGVQVRAGYSPQELADIYSYLIASDAFRNRLTEDHGPLEAGESIDAVRRLGAPGEEVTAEDLPPDRSVIPVLELRATAATPARARQLAERATASFIGYVADEQNRLAIPFEERVNLTVLETAGTGQSITRSPVGTMILVFAAVLCTFIALAFVGQNVSDHRHDRRDGLRALRDRDRRPLRPVEQLELEQAASAARTALEERTVRWFRRDDRAAASPDD